MDTEYVVTKRILKMQNPLDPDGPSRSVASTVRVRKPVRRKTGRLDFSDYSPLVASIDRSPVIPVNTTLTEGVVEDFRTYIGRGLDLKEACALSGVEWGTFCRWRVAHPNFGRFIDKCLVEQEMEALEHVRRAARGGVWQAGAWFLERRWPSKYGKRDMSKQELFVKYKEFIRIVLEVINDADPELKDIIVGKLRDRQVDIGDND